MFLEVLAFGDQKKVFKIQNSNVENGARWYRQPKGHQIWGFYQRNLDFASQLNESNVASGPSFGCDDYTDDPRRICWPIAGSQGDHQGGYKCGAHNDLYTDEWERLLLEKD